MDSIKNSIKSLNFAKNRVTKFKTTKSIDSIENKQKT